MVFFVIFLLLYMVFHSGGRCRIVLIFPTIYAMSGGLLLQWRGWDVNLSGRGFGSGYIALFGIAVETGVVVMVVSARCALDHKPWGPVTDADIHAAAIEGASTGCAQN